MAETHRRTVNDRPNVLEWQTCIVEGADAQVDARGQHRRITGGTDQHRQWTLRQSLGDEAAEKSRPAYQQDPLSQGRQTT